MKTVLSLSKLGDSVINVNLRLELRGEINEHSLSMALTELRSRVPEMKIDG